MEAALIAAQRGHDVTLLEKDKELGGLIKLAGAPDFKKRFNQLTDWYKRELRKAEVKIKLGKKATVDSVVKMKPDVVIVATGSKPRTVGIKGVDNAIIADDLLIGKGRVGQKVVIVGGGYVGGEVALHIKATKKVKEITVVEALDQCFSDTGMVERVALEKMLEKAKIKVIVSAPVTEIRKKEVIIGKKSGETSSIPADTVVLAIGRVSVNELEEKLRGKVPELAEIGDCVSPRKISTAIHEAFGATMFI